MKARSVYRVAKEFYETPQIQFHEPEKNINFAGIFGLRFTDVYGFHSQYVDLQEQTIKLFIKFTGKEKKCWECGGDRELVLSFDLEDELTDYRDLCDMPRIH